MSISNCSIDERGKATGGKAGDNNGKEWRIRSWYSSPWNCVLRYPDSKVRAMFSDMAEAAAKNNCVGYNQGKRLTFWNQLQKVDYKPENIKTKCDSDCSAGVAAIVKATGIRLGIKAMQDISPSLTTRNMRKALKAAGFEVLTASKYLTSDKYLLEGDILLNEGKHTCINLSVGSLANNTPVVANYKPTVREWQLAAIADGFKFPEYGADGLWGRECEAVAKQAIVKKRLTYKYRNLTKIVQKVVGVAADGKCGKDTAAAIKVWQAANGLEVDGAIGIIGWRKMLV